MTSALGNINSVKTNTCPHGLPLGACPICNGGMGGGTKIADKKNTPRNPGELTYAQCAAIGAMMKAAQARKEQNAEFTRFMENFQVIKKEFNNLVEKMQNILSKMQNSLPAPLAKTFGNIISPVINILKGIPSVVQNISAFISELRVQVMSAVEKLAAVVGEIKNFVSAKIKKDFEKIKKKILSLFGFSIIESGEDEEVLRELEIREAKKVKNLILKLFGDEKEENEHKQLENS